MNTSEYPRVAELMELWNEKGSWKLGIAENGLSVFQIGEKVGLPCAKQNVTEMKNRSLLYTTLSVLGKRLLEKHALNFGSVSFGKNIPVVYGIANTAAEHVAIAEKIEMRKIAIDDRQRKVQFILAKQLDGIPHEKKEDRLLILATLGKKVGRPKTKKGKK